MTNNNVGIYTIFDEKDEKGRSVRWLYSDGFGGERIFDDAWNKDIPAEVIETQHGKIVYERHYDEVVIDSWKGIGC